MKKLVFLLSSAVLLLNACTSYDAPKAKLNRIDFQTEIDGKQNDLYIMKNAAGMEVCMMNYGARIVSVMVPDQKGKFGDVVLGFDNIQDYLDNSTDFGAFIGRYGNRINQGKFCLDGVEYQLSVNNFGHSLHGGVKGFQYCMFDIKQLSEQSLEVSYVSEDGEMGFPGQLTVKAVYTLTDDNSIDIRYEAETDKPTIVNLTNHSYFNLSADPSQSITDHILMIDADAFTPVDSTFMTTGEIAPVCNTPMDFRKPEVIGKRIDDFSFEQLKNGNGYDHNWVLNTEGDATKLACLLLDPKSGRILKVFTSEPGVQVYTGNFLDGSLSGKNGVVYNQRAAICLETQHYPDSPNKADWPSVVLRPGEKYTSHCIYQFAVKCSNEGKECCGKNKKCCKEGADCKEGSACSDSCCQKPCGKAEGKPCAGSEAKPGRNRNKALQ